MIPAMPDAATLAALDFAPTAIPMFACPACGAEAGSTRCHLRIRGGSGGDSTAKFHAERRDAWLAWRLGPGRALYTSGGMVGA